MPQPPIDDERDKQLWLSLRPRGAAVPSGTLATAWSTLQAKLLGKVPEVAERGHNGPIWSLGGEDFRGLLGEENAEKYKGYVHEHGYTVHLRVDFGVRRRKLDPDFNIWSIHHPNEVTKHLFECGWTVAELTHQDAIAADFGGVVLVNPRSLHDKIQGAIEKAANAAGLKLEIKPWEVKDTSNVSNAIVISASESKDEIEAIRTKWSASICPVIVWTMVRPDADDRSLIEFYTMNQQSKDHIKEWVPDLLVRLAKGTPPEDALREASTRAALKLPGGSIRLRNATSTWSSRPRAAEYFRDHVKQHVELAGHPDTALEVRVLVTTVADQQIADRLLSGMVSCLKREPVELAQIQGDLSPDRWESEFRRRVSKHAEATCGDAHARPLWILQAVVVGEDKKWKERPFERVVNEYIDAIRRSKEQRIAVFLHLIIEDRTEAVEDMLKGDRKTLFVLQRRAS